MDLSEERPGVDGGRAAPAECVARTAESEVSLPSRPGLRRHPAVRPGSRIIRKGPLAGSRAPPNDRDQDGTGGATSRRGQRSSSEPQGHGEVDGDSRRTRTARDGLLHSTRYPAHPAVDRLDRSRGTHSALRTHHALVVRTLDVERLAPRARAPDSPGRRLLRVAGTEVDVAPAPGIQRLG